MGIYACDECFEKYGLDAADPTCHACCEVCGPLRGDWSQKFVTWTYDIDRQIPADNDYLRRRLAELLKRKAEKETA